MLQEDEEITCVVVIPVISPGRVQSVSHSTVLGFSSGIGQYLAGRSRSFCRSNSNILVRIYTESGQLIVQKCFHPSPVRHVKFQSMPEGKHSANILFTQSIQGIFLSLPFYLSVYISNYLTIYQSIDQSIYLSIYLSQRC